MSGAVPAYGLAPLEYRLALDAAASALGCGPVAWVCRSPALEGEVRQRFPDPAGPAPRGLLWVEPDLHGWPDELAGLARAAPPAARLAVVLSRPLARLIPERRAWAGRPLGAQPGGLRRLRRGLRAAGLAPLAERGFHGAHAVALSALAGLAGRAGRPALGDRLAAAARMRYVAAPPLAGLATVTLIVAARAGS